MKYDCPKCKRKIAYITDDLGSHYELNCDECRIVFWERKEKINNGNNDALRNSGAVTSAE